MDEAAAVKEKEKEKEDQVVQNVEEPQDQAAKDQDQKALEQEMDDLNETSTPVDDELNELDNAGAGDDQQTSDDGQSQSVDVSGADDGTGQAKSDSQVDDEAAAKLRAELDAEREKAAKLEETNANLNEGISSFRRKEKQLQEELNSLRTSTSAQPSDDGKPLKTDERPSIDPEVEQTVVSIVDRREQERIQKERSDLFESSEIAAIGKYGKQEYEDMYDLVFMPHVDRDTDLRTKWQAASDPCEFVMEHGQKIRDDMLKPHIDQAMESQKEKIFKELKENKLPVSLSSMGGGSPDRQSVSDLQKEMDDLDE